MPVTSEYLYVIKPTRLEMLQTGPTPEEDSILSEHFNYLKDLTTRGVVVLAGRTLTTDASSFGIVIFRAATPEEATAVMDRDPAVAGGVMSAQLYPYRIALLTGRDD